MKFNWNKILNERTVIHCDTEEKAEVLVSEAKSKHMSNYLGDYWHVYKDKTCYDIFTSKYGGLDYFKESNYTILTYEDVLDYKSLCGKLKIGDKIKHKGWSNITTIDLIGDNMCLEPREKIYVSCETAIHEENVDWKATYYANLKGDRP